MEASRENISYTILKDSILKTQLNDIDWETFNLILINDFMSITNSMASKN